jgi:3',5'-cyclic-AMP phosphodiesterase
MKRFAWLTDIHLNFLERPQCERFLDEVAQQRADGILIGGDIAEGHTLETYLKMIADRVGGPVYFVLGNHDFYYSSISATRATARAVCRVVPSLHWLSESGIVPLSDQTALIGCDGWADGRFGNFFESDVDMTDYFLIEDLSRLDREARFQKLNALGDEAAVYLRRLLPEALRQFASVILLTHVPPFREASWHEGGVCDDNHLPHFASRVIGETLQQVMEEHPTRQLTVLCGHTHGRGDIRMAPNLVVKTGGAEYGAPVIQEILHI